MFSVVAVVACLAVVNIVIVDESSREVSHVLFSPRSRDQQ